MPNTLSLLLAAAATGTGTASALAVREADCTFTMTTGGDVSFPVGQYDSGQTRAGTGLSPATFTISSNNTLTDSQGRGCWWTPPATVLQCDVGQVPETGFAIGCDGRLTFGSQSTFYECGTGTDDQVDIYLNPNQGTNCGEITLTANSCMATDCSGGSTTTASPSSTESCSSDTTSIATPTESYAVSSPSASLPVTQTYTDIQPSVSTIYSTVWRSITDCDVATSTIFSCADDCTSASVQDSTLTTQPADRSTQTQTETLYTYISITLTTPGTATSGDTSCTESSTSTQQPTQSSVATTSYSAATETPAAGVTSQASTATPTSMSIPSPSSVSIPSSCPGNVTNAGEFTLPRLIIPVDSSAPGTARGTSYFGQVNSTTSTIFDFDIPSGASGRTCNLVFLFPERDTLETSSFTFSGSGSVSFSRLSAAAGLDTTYGDMPAVESRLAELTVAPGNAYDIASFACPSGDSIGVEMAITAGGDTSLEFFQDYNPCPLGVFITTS